MVLLIVGIILIALIIIMAITIVIHNKVFGKRYTANPLVKGFSIADFNLNIENVSFACGHDTLRGNLYSYDDYDLDKIVIFCHGMGCDHISYIQDIEYLCRNKFLVLGFDYIGSSLSDGKNIKGLSSSLKCCDYAVKFVKEKFPKKDIYVVGHSWGAFACLNVIKYHKDIKGVVALAPFVSVYSCLHEYLPKKLWFFIPFSMIIEFSKFGGYAFANSINSLKKYKNKCLILASTNDPSISYNKNTSKIKKECPNFNYLILDDRFHNPEYTHESSLKLLNYIMDVKKIKKEDYVSYMNSINFKELGELDYNIMDKIIEFINKN